MGRVVELRRAAPRRASRARGRSRRGPGRGGPVAAVLKFAGVAALGAALALGAVAHFGLPAFLEQAPRPLAKVGPQAERPRTPVVTRPDSSVRTSALRPPAPPAEIRKAPERAGPAAIRPPVDSHPVPRVVVPGAPEPKVLRLSGLVFPLCGEGAGGNCVVDGDTFVLGGRAFRVADIDTPEIGDPKCAREARLGARAKKRLQQLLNAGPIELRSTGRDEDVYGRKLRTVHRNGRSLGEVLVSEGLAHRWTGAKRSWCA